MSHDKFLVVMCAVFTLGCGAYFLLRAGNAPTPPAKTETLSCVRVKEVTPAGTIKYYCEVRK